MKSAAARSTRFTSCSSLPSRNARTRSAIHNRQVSSVTNISRHAPLTTAFKLASPWAHAPSGSSLAGRGGMATRTGIMRTGWSPTCIITVTCGSRSCLHTTMPHRWGRELTDDKRQRILDSDSVQRYLDARRGAIFADSRRKRAPSPLRLARLLCRWRSEYTSRTLERIGGIPEDDIRTKIERVPDEFMSEIARAFAFQIVMTGRRELLRSVR